MPNLVLQPIVENAIRHGIEPHAKPGTILLAARRNGDTLTLEVRDNGKGIPGEAIEHEGVGLSNTRARLRELYGTASSFVLRNAPGGGFMVTITLPFRPRPNDGDPSTPRLNTIT